VQAVLAQSQKIDGKVSTVYVARIWLVISCFSFFHHNILQRCSRWNQQRSIATGWRLTGVTWSAGPLLCRLGFMLRYCFLYYCIIYTYTYIYIRIYIILYCDYIVLYCMVLHCIGLDVWWVWYGHGMVMVWSWHGMVWYGLVWLSFVWYGIVYVLYFMSLCCICFCWSGIYLYTF
jgi:hypothetical protein